MAISNRTATTANSGSSAASSITLNNPTGTSAGDLLITTISINNGSSASITTLSGWTLLNRHNNTTILGQGVYYRVADGTEGSSFTWSCTSEFVSAVCDCYTGVDPNNPFSGEASTGNTSASTTVTFPAAIVPTSENVYEAFFCSTRNTTGTTTNSSVGTGLAVDGDTCTTATDFIETMAVDGLSKTLPLATHGGGTCTQSRSVTSIVLLVLLRPLVTTQTGNFSIDVATYATQITGSGTVTTPSFSTGYNSELLLVECIGDASQSTSNLAVSGGGLTWTKQLVVKNASPNIIHYIFTAVASTPLSNVTVTATDSGDTSTDWSIYLTSILGANNSSPIGASNSAFGSSIVSTSVTTTANGSWIWATWQNSQTNGGAPTLSGTPSTVQSLFGFGDTNAGNYYQYWLQTSDTTSSGTSVTMNTTAPTAETQGVVAFELMAASTGTSASVTQVAATLTFTGGTQSIATVQDTAVAQSAATLTFTGGTQVSQTLASVTQSAATLTFNGGTQSAASVQDVSIGQVGATLTFTGGIQSTNVNTAQTGATLTFTGGTQSTNVTVTQSAATLTFNGGTQAVAAVQIVSVAQVGATLTFSGGTQSTAINIAQVAASLTFTGGTQSTNVNVTQSAATLTLTGGTQGIATVNIASVSQSAVTLTLTGGTQTIATVNDVVLTQSHATLTFTGGTQAIVTIQVASISQSATTITFTGGTQSVRSNTPSIKKEYLLFGFKGFRIKARVFR